MDPTPGETIFKVKRTLPKHRTPDTQDTRPERNEETLHQHIH
jgi:hypothetical protein